MATTDGALLARAVDAMVTAGVDLAFLHGEARAAAGQTRSDVDLVVDRPARAILEAVDWGDGLHPFILWPYDTGAASLFLATSDGRDGVHLDLTFDRSARGKYKLRALDLLGRSTSGVRWNVVASEDEARYLSLKRKIKSQARQQWPKPGRALSRFLRPVGFWLHAANLKPEVFGEVASRFGAFLPGTATHGLSLHTRAVIEIERRRPWVVLTSGRPNLAKGCDLELEVVNADDCSRRIVSACAERLTVLSDAW